MGLFAGNKYIWAGGFYELAIELRPRSEARLEAALLAPWQNARLDGCYVRRDLEPADQQRTPPSLTLLERYGHLLGVSTLPNGRLIATTADQRFTVCGKRHGSDRHCGR